MNKQRYKKNDKERIFSYNKNKSKKLKKLGIIPEENNNINTELEQSNIRPILINKNKSFKTQYNLLIKDIEIDTDSKFNTQRLNSDKKFQKILNEMSEDKKENTSNEKINSNKNDIIIFDSGKKKDGLIKLISSNNSDSLGNEKFTKNINLNININNNIQYEIDKNKKNKEEENNDLNQSLNSLIKIAEKNCLYFNDCIDSESSRDINKGINKNNEKKIYNSNNKENIIKVGKHKNKLNKNNNLNLSSQSNQTFKKISNTKPISDNKNFKKKEINQIKQEKINEDNITNKTLPSKNIIPKGNNIKDKNPIYNKKKNIQSSKEFKNTTRNQSLQLRKKENGKIYKKIRNDSLNAFSIGKKNIIELNDYNKIDNGINTNKNSIKYHNSTYHPDINLFNQQAFHRYTYNEKNFNKLREEKFLANNRFFEANISLDNCFSNRSHYENNIDYGMNKIYKRPTVFISKNNIKKGKSLEKTKSQDFNIIERKTSRQQKKVNYNRVFQRAKTNKNNPVTTYIKKNLQNPQNTKSNNILSNNKNNKNIYVITKSRNERLYNDGNELNTFNYNNKINLDENSNLNLKKYEEIYNNGYQKNLFHNNNINFSQKLGDLLILEEKLCDIILNLKKYKKADNQCYDFLIFYFNFSMYKHLEKIFGNEIDEEIVRLYLNYALITILITYKFSINYNELLDILSLIEILQLCHRNLILIYEQILNLILKENIKNKWVEKLQEIVKYSKNSSGRIFQNENIITSLIGKINFNTNCLIKKIKSILYINKYEDKNLIINFIKNLNQKTYEEIYIFFKEHIFIIDNIEGSIPPSIYKPRQYTQHHHNYPFIKEPNKKKYSLILDLNETLISLKYTNNSKGLIRVRPYLYEFLDEVNKYYEIILFTGSTKIYAESIIEALEKKKKYFDYILYREYLVKCGDCYLKDLSKIGRPLDSVIIVDNNLENFKIHKENGIYIKSFWGENNEDNALYNLTNILVKIAKEKSDVRDGLRNLRDEIIFKISGNLS